MSHIIHVQLGEGFTDGYFVIQPDYDRLDFAILLQQAKLPVALQVPYLTVYCDFIRSESGTIVCDSGGPWVIVVFGSDPALIRRLSLQEIKQLSKAVTQSDEMRYRFIDQVYAAVRLPGGGDEAG